MCRFLEVHSFILETYIAPLQETTTQRRCRYWNWCSHARGATSISSLTPVLALFSDYGTDELTTTTITAYLHSFIHSFKDFIHSFKDLYSPSSRKLLRGAPDSSTVKKNSFQ